MKKVYVIVKIVFNYPAQEESVRYLSRARKRVTWVSSAEHASEFDFQETALTVLDELMVFDLKDHYRIDTHYVKE